MARGKIEKRGQRRRIVFTLMLPELRMAAVRVWILQVLQKMPLLPKPQERRYP